MITYSLGSTKIYRIGRTRNDDRSPIDPWSLPDWKYGPFEGRFADPAVQYRVRYVGLTPYGAYIESLQRYRPDLELLKELSEITGTDEPVLGPAIPASYFDDYALASADLSVPGDQGLLDLVTGRGIGKAHPAIFAAARKSGFALKHYDASTLLSATPREFTQAISRVVFEYNQFNGIAYRSRFDPGAICLGLFEGAHDLANAQYDPIVRTSREFRDACAVHNLPESSDARTRAPDATS